MTVRRLLASLLVIAGCAVALASGVALLWPERVQSSYMRVLPPIESDEYTASAPPDRGDMIGVLNIPRLGVSSIVIEGDDARALLFGVGHLAETPLPWHDGNSVLAAHRDTFFRPLERIRRDDVIRFATADAELEYVVVETKIVEPTDLEILDPTSSAMLTLITCYPFDYIGPAPQRFIVRAERRSS